MNDTVRKANINDLESLVDFAAAEAREAEGITELKNVENGVKIGLEDSTIAQYWILEDVNGKLIGNISVVKEWSNWNSGYYWWIQSLYIIAEHRGKGLTRFLFETVKETAKKEDALDIRLHVHQKKNKSD